MAWYSHPSYHVEVKDFNQELKAMHGELDLDTAKITLAKFLYRNLGFTVNFCISLSCRLSTSLIGIEYPIGVIIDICL